MIFLNYVSYNILIIFFLLFVSRHASVMNKILNRLHNPSSISYLHIAYSSQLFYINVPKYLKSHYLRALVFLVELANMWLDHTEFNLQIALNREPH